MAVTTYNVKRGDSLWKIASNPQVAPLIAGNTTNAKIDTLVALNNIPNRNLIYAGQTLILSGDGGSSSSTSSSTSGTAATNSNAVRIDVLALQAESSTGRDVFAYWTWSKADTKEYEVQWEYDAYGTTRYEKRTVTNTWDSYSIPEEARKICNWVQVFITPIANNTKDSQGQDTGNPIWKADRIGKQYLFKDNPPLKPSNPPSLEIDKDSLVLTMSMSDIVASDLDATGVKFNIVRDNTTSIHTSSAVAINTETNYVSYQYTVEPGHTYTVRACSVGSNGKDSAWSNFSNEVGTKPSAPAGITTYRRNKRTDGAIAAYLEWSAVTNAKTYKIEYVTVESDFETTPGNIQEVTTENARTSLEIILNETGKDYFFRVRAVNDNGESDPTAVVKIPIGSTPAAPSTWSSSESAFVGETMELNWVHNPTDNSKQTYAQLSFNINDTGWVTLEVFENTTDPDTTGERVDETKYTYGTAVSYKGNMYFKMDTTHPELKNAKIQWKARTAGVTDAFSDIDWSVERTIYIYEKPSLALSMTSDLAGTGPLITTLTSFPFYIRGQISLSDHTIQRPVGYHLQIISNEYYVTADDLGRTKTINPGDPVYSKYFSTSDTLIVEMSANNIDLESGISYTVYCNVDMSTGLTVSNQDNLHNFTVDWIDIEYKINADISISKDAYTALITPYCADQEGNLIENVTLSVYRREYDGSYKEIATGIPNNYTAVTDPHPALDYARYRFIAKDTRTGAISFYDMAGFPVNGYEVVLQWDEEWSTFDMGESTSVEGPPWSGSLLKLPYNIKVTDSRKPSVSLVEYAGRKYAVSYYGTAVDESSQWSVDIPKEDKDTIYALRRLSLWTGDVYVREPSGMGYWANVGVSFSQSYDDVKIPISLDIKRVEGGV